MSGSLQHLPGGSGKPLSPAEALAANIRELALVEGARIELTGLRRGLDARIRQLTDDCAKLHQRSEQLAAEMKRERKGKIIVTDQLPPNPKTP